MTSQIGEFDFETRSAAGYTWDAAKQKLGALPGLGSAKRGLKGVGAPAYAEHHSTAVLTLSYKLPLHWIGPSGELRIGGEVRRWRPGLPNPQELFDYLAAGGLLEAHNVMFERLIWKHVCTRLYGWPDLEPFQYQLRCSMAKARVNSLPGSLGDLSDVLKLTVRKDADGKRLLDKFSVPRNPTKADPRVWITPEEDPLDAERLYGYCDTDVLSESEASSKMQPLSDDEVRFWLIDQEINMRGVAIDRQGVRDSIAVLEQVFVKYEAECLALTGLRPSQRDALLGWLRAQGVSLPNMRADTIKSALGPDFAKFLDGSDDEDTPAEEDPLDSSDDEDTPAEGDPLDMPPHARRALELRALTASASVKKLYAMEHRANSDDRLRDLITHHGARTGRPTGHGPQPLNLPKAGPDLRWCVSDACHRPFRPDLPACPWCATPATPDANWVTKWPGRPKPIVKIAPDAVDVVLEVMSWRSLDAIEYFIGDALLAISGSLRGMFIAGPGCDFIASDFSSIEAVVLAQLAGERWRVEAFEQGAPMYLLSASKITGIPLEEYLRYYEEHNEEHHPDRGKIGKVNELANGFGGWIGSSKAFGSTEPDDVIKSRILAWRGASPSIPEFWGGQFRGLPWDRNRRRELFGLEGHAIAAIQNPGLAYEFRGIGFYMRGTALIVRLLSGRELTYHSPRVVPSQKRQGEQSLVYWTWNTNAKYGARGWGPMDTYGGRLCENVVQAVAHDILRYAIENLRAAGYPTVLHVYDEIIVEVPHGTGSIEEVERIMGTMPPWAVDSETGRPWPIRAEGGWRGRRYRKG